MLKARIGVVATAALLTVAAAPAASADTGAFWGYWQESGGSSWDFAKTGPASTHPHDGAVEGWRFARSSGNTGTPPRARPDFAKICGSTPAQAGRERVAVVIDYGVQADAPSGARPPAARTSCALVPPNASGSDILAAVARPKPDKSGLICAIDAFGPCGSPQAAGASPAAEHTPAAKKKGAGATAMTIGVGVVLVLAALASTTAVRRRARQ